MRETFHAQLAELREQLADMCTQAASAMRSATRALVEGDAGLARQVLDDDVELDRTRDRCEQAAQQLLALQAPVARDLRFLLTVVHCAVKIERMGDLAAHAAETVLLAHPRRPVPADLDEEFAELGLVAVGMADRLAELIRSAAEGCYAELNETDRIVDALHARVMATITGSDWQHGVQSAMSLALLARFYERFADQAVSVAKRLEFAVTGELPDATVSGPSSR